MDAKQIPEGALRQFLRWLLCVEALTLGQSCIASVDRTPQEHENVATQIEALGTVQGHPNSHLYGAGAESVVTTMSSLFEVTASFNAIDSSQFMTFNNNSRQVFSGASLMRWAQMNPSGSVVASGRLSPPSG